MLLHLVLSQQLKKRPKGLPAEKYVLVDANGKVYAPIGQGESSVFKDEGLVYDVQNGDVIVNTDFTKLEVAIAKKKMGGVNNVCMVLQRAQSVTIQYISSTLDISRETAKQLLDILVASGAYTKYYSYWRRTAAFSDWLVNRKEKV